MCLFIKQQIFIFIMVVVIQSNTDQYIIVELRILIYDSGTSNEKIYKRDIQL